MALKSIIAQLINSIGIPIVANYFIRENIYGNEGLVYDVFVLSFTNALVPPIAKVIDLPYRCCQLYAKYMSRPKNKLYLNQYELNSIYEKLEF